MPSETLQWTHLYDEVVTSGLCTGCAGCVVACPHDVLGYDERGGRFKPFHLEAELGAGDCGHGVKGCTACTRACPRFRSWESEADQILFGRPRRADEVAGVSLDVILARASQDAVAEIGQDGGLVSAILIYALENGFIDAALVSNVEWDGHTWAAIPGVATDRDEVLAAAGSRYTYSANTLAYGEAVALGAEKIALVGMGCQTSAVPIMAARRAGKVGRRIALSIGLMCSKTFDDRIFKELFQDVYGIRAADIRKVNIKGVFQIWTRDGMYYEVPLKECYPWTREGCNACPDFAAEHADISTGGIGAYDGWTLTMVRTGRGRELLIRMLEDGVIEARPGEDDPGALKLLQLLSKKSRKRWPIEVSNRDPALIS